MQTSGKSGRGDNNSDKIRAFWKGHFGDLIPPISFKQNLKKYAFKKILCNVNNYVLPSFVSVCKCIVRSPVSVRRFKGASGPRIKKKKNGY
jgi:hypothetical protein